MNSGNVSYTRSLPSPTKNSTQSRLSVEKYHVGLITLAVLIVIMNIFAIQIYKRHEKIRQNCINILLVSLAVTDLIVGVVHLPFVITCETYLYMHSRKACSFTYIIGNFCSFSTVFHIVALTIEKYVAVLHPFKRISVSTSSVYRKIIIAVWFFSLVFSMIPMPWMYGSLRYSPSFFQFFRLYGIAQTAIFLGLATLILLYCYVRMLYQIHAKLATQNIPGRVHTKAISDRKTIFVFLMFFMIFIVGWTPWFFFFINPKHEKLVSQEVKDFLVSLRYLGAALNPLLYSFLKIDYKHAIQADFKKIFVWWASAPVGFQTMTQSSTIQRAKNTSRKGTLTSDTLDIHLTKMKAINEQGEAQSTTSEIPPDGH